MFQQSDAALEVLFSSALSTVTLVYTSVFQPGFRGSSEFREWLPEVPPKQTRNCLDEIRNHSPMRL